jgi:hypothetical protein
VGVVVIQRVAVTHHTGRCVETGDGQRAAERRSDRLWEACSYAIGDHGDTADGQAVTPSKAVMVKVPL